MTSANIPDAYRVGCSPLRRRLHHAGEMLLQHGEVILCHASALALMANLVLTPRRFPAPARIIGQAYLYRFWRPATVGEMIDIILALLIWPFAIVICVLWCTARNGAFVEKSFDRSKARQCIDQLKMALTSGLAPPWYYVFELYRADRINGARAYLTRAETKHGTIRLLAAARGSFSPLDDKEAFAHFCEERQLNALPVLFSIHDGELRCTGDGCYELPRLDLFVKPVCGRGGHGAERWNYRGEGIYCTPSGLCLSAPQLIRRLREMSRWQPYLVQERAQNHHTIADLSNGALNTVRVISCLDEHDQPEITGAVLKMAVGGNVTIDNVHAGAIAAAVDLVSGRLGQATYAGFDASKGWIDRHPVTRAPIKGRELPMWKDACELVKRAHSAFGDWVVVGWDVAITAADVRLVEGNCGPDIDLIQRPLRTAFGDSRLGELIAFHLTRTQHAPRSSQPYRQRVSAAVFEKSDVPFNVEISYPLRRFQSQFRRELCIPHVRGHSGYPRVRSRCEDGDQSPSSSSSSRW